MKKIPIIAFLIILFFTIINSPYVLAEEYRPLTEVTASQIIQSIEEDTPLEDLLEELKGRSIEKDIEIYYLEKTIKQTIIQEAPKDEYLEHLLQALKDSLKKGKKTGKIRRVEKDLVEIDKGAIHKVRERDVYDVYDSSTGAYKGRVEIQAIADAVSIGKNYNLMKSSVNVRDTIKYLGNRKYMELGALAPTGFVWRYVTRGGYCIELSGGYYDKVYYYYPGGEFERYKFIIAALIGIKKYFNHPSLFSPCIGVGITFGNWHYSYLREYLNDIKKRKAVVSPYLSIGFQLFSSAIVHIDLDVRYILWPDWEYEKKPEPIMYFASATMCW